MKDMITILDNQLNKILGFLEEGNLDSCTYVSHEIILVSSLSENRDVVFIGEVLEQLFEQTSMIRFVNDEKNQLISQLKQHISNLIKIYKSDDAVKKYEILRDMRYLVTKLQHEDFLRDLPNMKNIQEKNS